MKNRNAAVLFEKDKHESFIYSLSLPQRHMDVPLLKNEKVRSALAQAEFAHIIGQEATKRDLKSALLAGRNIIIVGPPGVGKTTVAKSVADTIRAVSSSCPFVRVQGSPDLTAEDLIGDIDPVKALAHGALSSEAFTPGKIFKADGGILFFDEVNRCSEKLQNALLQALEERKVTIGKYDVDLPANFLFIGTMNPEDSSTEKLSDVFLDRFDLVAMSYPENEAAELEIIGMHGTKAVPVPEKITRLIAKFIGRLRRDERIEKKPSVRATLGLYDRAQTTAQLRKAKQVAFPDVAANVVSVLAHRISMKPSVRYLQSTDEYILREFQAFTREAGDEGDDP